LPEANTSPASRFSRDISSTTLTSSSGDAIPRLMAVVAMPEPSGLVRRSTSPGLPPALVRIRRGCTTPVTAIPYFGSGSSTE